MGDENKSRSIRGYEQKGPWERSMKKMAPNLSILGSLLAVIHKACNLVLQLMKIAKNKVHIFEHTLYSSYKSIYFQQCKVDYVIVLIQFTVSKCLRPLSILRLMALCR